MVQVALIARTKSMFTMMTVNTVNIAARSSTVQVALTVQTKSTGTDTEATSAYGAVLPLMGVAAPTVPQRFTKNKEILCYVNF